MSEAEAQERPTSIALEGDLVPRSPFECLGPGLAGGFTREGWHLLAAWCAFFLATSGLFASHLMRLAGWSALPSHWGDYLTARDLWELLEHGGLKQHPLGPLTPWAAVLTLAWVLWAGWRHQALRVGLHASLKAWFLGGLDALLIGALPLGVTAWLGLQLLDYLGGSGIPPLGWLDFILGTLFRLGTVSAWMLVWWFCRLGRAAAPWSGWAAYVHHLRDACLRLWMHPVQWFLVVLGGATLRAGLGFGALAFGWWLGGGTPGRVWAFVLIQLLACLLSAWALGWFLRTAALFWRQDRRVRQVRSDLEAAVNHES